MNSTTGSRERALVLLPPFPMEQFYCGYRSIKNKGTKWA